MDCAWLVLAMAALAASDPARLLTLGSQPAVEYGADAVMETEAGRVPSKVWFAKGRERREMVLDGGTTTLITRVDKKVVWRLVPEQRLYEETPFAENVTRAPFAGEVPPFEIGQQTYVADETVNGIPCRKTKVTLTDTSNGVKLAGFFWTTGDGILVKVDAVPTSEGAPSRFVLELTNVAVGPQPPELFEIPAGFMKVVVPPVQGTFRPHPRGGRR